MGKPTFIFVAGSFRTGSTTQYRMCRDIVVETGNGIGHGYHQEKKLKHDDVPRSGRYVVSKVFEYLPAGFRGNPSHGGKIFREKRLKVTVTIRNPLDMITSMMERHHRLLEDPKHQRQPFDFQHRAAVEFPIWLAQLQRWIDLGPKLTLVSRYEVFTQDLPREVRRIADHIQIRLSDEKVTEIASRYTLQGIAEHKKKYRKAKKREDPHLPSIPGTLFGYSGAYQSHLTEEQIRMMMKYNGEWIKKWGYA